MFKIILRRNINTNEMSKVIGTADTKDAAFKMVANYLAIRNDKPHYRFTWEVDDKTNKIDFGSHTEFFYIQEE